MLFPQCISYVFVFVSIILILDLYYKCFIVFFMSDTSSKYRELCLVDYHWFVMLVLAFHIFKLFCFFVYRFVLSNISGSIFS